MTIRFCLNRPREFQKGYLNAIIDCGYLHNRWVQTALEYVPEHLFDQRTDFLFTSTATSDACRVARDLCRTREIILVSERILPSENVRDETNPKARYFIYAVLHEIAHALRAHKSPLLDALKIEEYEAQEEEADELAMKWFNDHVVKRNNIHLLPITKGEIKEAQEKNQEVMTRLWKGI
ncbi:MAG TPA: hypothetical protein VEF34_09880 [Syntrophobacteraceae bacterium]|nr:hypothetical protein [Syntrophobacteraceae bacterium]